MTQTQDSNIPASSVLASKLPQAWHQSELTESGVAKPELCISPKFVDARSCKARQGPLVCKAPAPLCLCAAAAAAVDWEGLSPEVAVVAVSLCKLVGGHIARACNPPWLCVTPQPPELSDPIVFAADWLSS